MIITEKINGKCGKGRPCAISEYAWKYWGKPSKSSTTTVDLRNEILTRNFRDKKREWCLLGYHIRWKINLRTLCNRCRTASTTSQWSIVSPVQCPNRLNVLRTDTIKLRAAKPHFKFVTPFVFGACDSVVVKSVCYKP
jgi:hypothetical protein